MIHATCCKLVVLFATGVPNSFSVVPGEMVLDGHPASIVATESRDDRDHDVTTECEIRIENEQIARIDGATVYPKMPGETRLIVERGDQTLSVPLRVQRLPTEKQISFRNDVIPVLTKSGCNSGACHGAAAGQDGFGLSLFGYDPTGDYQVITRQWVGRRVNKGLPEESLLLKKAIGAVPHTGGSRVKPGSAEYRTLAEWISQGALDDEIKPPRVDRLVLYPTQLTLDVGASHRLVAIAGYEDGSRRDVTHLAEFNTTNGEIAQVDHDGILQAAGAGEAYVTARFDSLLAGQAAVVVDGGSEEGWQPQPPLGEIDRLVDEKLRRRQISPSPQCDDETFLRRVSLDLRGRLPSEEEWEEFVSDTGSDKRDRTIQRYLQSEEFVDTVTMRWSDVLKIRSGTVVSRSGVHRYAGWLRKQIQSNTPLNRWVHDLISVRGDSRNNPAGYFFQTEKEKTKQAENIAQIFLGMRLQCASCHNHPFDRWTMDDYYGFAAFFAQTGKKPGEDPREIILYDTGEGEIKHPLTKDAVSPRFLGGQAPSVGDRDRRSVLAEWIVDDENPYFAKHMANTLWSWMFYRGIVDQPDDVRISNPPTNAPLLEYLAGRLRENGYDIRSLLAEICQSRTYQSSVRGDIAGLELFAGQRLRRLPAAVLHDAIVQVTEAETKFEKTPPGTSAVSLADAAITNTFLETFGRSPRTTVCTCEAKNEPTLSQALHLVNGNSVQGKIESGKVVERMLSSGKDVDGVIDALYLRTLSRLPASTERTAIRELIDEQSPREGLNDVFWAILNSAEFSMNH